MSGPALSNYLADLAERAGNAFRTFERATRESVDAYLEAGAVLAEARAAAKRGEWAPFLARAGIQPRTGRNMMRLARAGMTADAIVSAGGVKAALLSLANPKAIAIVESQIEDLPGGEVPGEVRDRTGKRQPVSATASPAPAPNPAISGPREVPDPAGARPVAHESGLAAGDPRSVRAGEAMRTAVDAALAYSAARADAPTSHRSSLQDGQPAESAGDADPALERGPAGGTSLYKWRRWMGDCTVCGAPADGAARCGPCAGKLNRKRRSRTRIAGELVTRIEAAAASGDGLNLTPADVARLAGDGPRPERCGRTVDWVGESG